jgi:hypothetical protein
LSGMLSNMCAMGGMDTWWSRELTREGSSLTPDVRASVTLSAWSETYAKAIEAGRWTRELAVARLSLAARCRPDLIEQEIEVKTRSAERSIYGNWPAVEDIVSLLAAAQELTAGTGALAGPDGIRVVHVTEHRPDGTVRRRYLRVTRHGQPLGEPETVAGLAELVDLNTLQAEPAGPAV